MAISQNFLTGRMRKSAGGTRFSTWKGLNIVAAKPISVRQNVTPAVQLNRNKLSVIGKAVSKMNASLNLFYNFGIQKTTPFADTVKFFRNRLKDDLKLDAALFQSAKFGTGNAEGLVYDVVDTAINSLSLSASLNQNSNPFWTDNRTSSVLIINDLATKMVVEEFEISEDEMISINLSSTGFEEGDKILIAVKDRKFEPGNDLAGKVKFIDNNNFITLTS